MAQHTTLHAPACTPAALAIPNIPQPPPRPTGTGCASSRHHLCCRAAGHPTPRSLATCMHSKTRVSLNAKCQKRHGEGQAPSAPWLLRRGAANPRPSPPSASLPPQPGAVHARTHGARLRRRSNQSRTMAGSCQRQEHRDGREPLNHRPSGPLLGCCDSPRRPGAPTPRPAGACTNKVGVEVHTWRAAA